MYVYQGKNGNKRGGGWPLESDSRSRSILKNKESRGTDSELLLQETTSLGANVRFLFIISIYENRSLLNLNLFYYGLLLLLSIQGR